jgi:GTP diphosphokinase / guanosine-3',5'-bis(diphosphate) 3'-diphosphatase
MDLIQKAFVKAYDLHKHQRRKQSKTPYLVHLLDAAKYLMYETDDEEIICAGILHDTLEDTDYSEDALRADFGDRVCSLVMFCTEPNNNYRSTQDEMKNSWKERKSHSVMKLNDASNDELPCFLCG